MRSLPDAQVARAGERDFQLKVRGKSFAWYVGEADRLAAPAKLVARLDEALR